MTPFIELARKLRGIFGTLPTGFPGEWQLLPPLHINEDGWLEGEGVVHMPMHSSWHYPRLSTPTGDPLAIVCHVSATNLGTGVNMAKRRMVQRKPEDRAASWHVSVEADSIIQMASFEVGTWHALGSIPGVGPANRTSVGVEFVGWEKGPFPDNQVLQGARLWRALVQSYGIKREHAMVEHSKIDPDRRTDPGAVFMAKHAAAMLGYAFG